MRTELEAYGAGLADKPEVIALNKSDTLDDELIAALSDELEAESGARGPSPSPESTGAGVEAVLDALCPTSPRRGGRRTRRGGEPIDGRRCDERKSSPVSGTPR